MFKQLRTLALVSAIALTLVSVTGSAFAATAQEITNARQESQISTSYALSPYLRAHDITVTVDNGHATLTGKVDEDVNKELAKQIALGVSGIKEVDNQLVVMGDYTPPARTEDQLRRRRRRCQHHRGHQEQAAVEQVHQRADHGRRHQVGSRAVEGHRQHR